MNLAYNCKWSHRDLECFVQGETRMWSPHLLKDFSGRQLPIIGLNGISLVEWTVSANIWNSFRSQPMPGLFVCIGCEPLPLALVLGLCFCLLFSGLSILFLLFWARCGLRYTYFHQNCVEHFLHHWKSIRPTPCWSLKCSAFLTVKWWCPCFHAGPRLTMCHNTLVNKYMHRSGRDIKKSGLFISKLKNCSFPMKGWHSLTFSFTMRHSWKLSWVRYFGCKPNWWPFSKLSLCGSRGVGEWDL